SHWPAELHLPSPLIDRDNREAWTRAGAKEIDERAIEDVDRRLAAYRQLETDPLLDAELRRIIRAGLVDPDAALPQVPPAPEPAEAGDAGPGRRHNRRRERPAAAGTD
ncbi:MAG: trimethylamine---corrinoid protein Co-methyltransferase, partial [Chloroflexota bacterium]|nr:trimethylamine---corrinoid protein Co-methyltransferase [Chloroflexota bacterium]